MFNLITDVCYRKLTVTTTFCTVAASYEVARFHDIVSCLSTKHDQCEWNISVKNKTKLEYLSVSSRQVLPRRPFLASADTISRHLRPMCRIDKCQGLSRQRVLNMQTSSKVCPCLSSRLRIFERSLIPREFPRCTAKFFQLPRILTIDPHRTSLNAALLLLPPRHSHPNRARCRRAPEDQARRRRRPGQSSQTRY
jgi:hypothetical protein